MYAKHQERWTKEGVRNEISQMSRILKQGQIISCEITQRKDFESLFEQVIKHPKMWCLDFFGACKACAYYWNY